MIKLISNFLVLLLLLLLFKEINGHDYIFVCSSNGVHYKRTDQNSYVHAISFQNVSACGVAISQRSSSIVYQEGNRLRILNMCTNTERTISTEMEGLFGFAVNERDNLVYYADGSCIYSYNINGSSSEMDCYYMLPINLQGHPLSLVYDPFRQFLFIAQYGTEKTPGIHRLTLSKNISRVVEERIRGQISVDYSGNLYASTAGGTKLFRYSQGNDTYSLAVTLIDGTGNAITEDSSVWVSTTNAIRRRFPGNSSFEVDSNFVNSSLANYPTIWYWAPPPPDLTSLTSCNTEFCQVTTGTDEVLTTLSGTTQSEQRKRNADFSFACSSSTSDDSTTGTGVPVGGTNSEGGSTTGGISDTAAPSSTTEGSATSSTTTTEIEVVTTGQDDPSTTSYDDDGSTTNQGSETGQSTTGSYINNTSTTISTITSQSDNQFRDNDNNNDDNGSTVIIAISVIAGLILLLVIAGLIVFIIIRKRKSRSVNNDDLPSVEMSDRSTLYNSITVPGTIEANQVSTNYQIGLDDTSTTLPPLEAFDKQLTPQKSKYIIKYDEIDQQEELGRGSFGVVFLGTWRLQLVAVKKILGELDVTQQEEFLREIEVLMNLRPHKNIVLFLGVCVSPLCIVTEYYKNGNLLSYLRKNNKLSESVVRKIILGIAAGMAHLHTESIIHRDLATRNILLSAEMDPVVSDFGFARIVMDDSAKTRSEIGPLRWMSPESLRSKVYGVKTDVWSFGVTCWEILSGGKTPYQNHDQAFEAAMAVLQGLRLTIPNEWPKDIQNMIRKCFETNPDDRPTFTEIFQMISSK